MIEFESVSFSYEGQEHGGLHGISLKNCRRGNVSCSVAVAGVEKTTVTRLVNGLIPQFLPGRTSRACAGGRTGNQQPAHVSDRRKGGLRLSESPDAVFQCGYGQ